MNFWARLLCLNRGRVDRLVEGDVAVTRHEENGAVVALRLDVSLDRRAGAVQLCGIEAQLASHERLAEREERTRVELERLDVRLDESVARATELGTRAGGAEDLDAIEASITDVVGSLEALRLGLDDVEGMA